jgi:L-malate glycosyltransferase
MGIRMKIGMVCYPSIGGSGVLATKLGEELASRGHQIHFIAYEPPFRLDLQEKNIFFHEVEVSHYDLFKYPDYALTLSVKMAAIARQYQLDLFHVHYAIPHATSAYLAKQLLKENQIKVITTLHGTDISLLGKELAYHSIIKFSIEKSDGITAVSNYLKQETCHQFGIKNPIDVIYNFFNPIKELIGHKTKHDLFVLENQKLIVHTSNYRAVKCPKDVYRIFSKIRKKIPCKLLLLGEGNGLEEIRNEAEAEGLLSEMIFLGRSHQIDSYVASGDLFLLPSSQESFGLAALEAMAYGVPVIGTSIGGLPELIEHGTTGYLAPIGEVDQMADYAIKLLEDQDLYRSFSNASIQTAHEKFSSEKIVPLYEAYYIKILNQAEV